MKPSPEPAPTTGRARAIEERRRIEDELIAGFADAGWTMGAAASELDLDLGAMSRHSKRLGIVWNRPGRSVRGEPVAGIEDLANVRSLLR